MRSLTAQSADLRKVLIKYVNVLHKRMPHPSECHTKSHPTTSIINHSTTTPIIYQN